ncbi:MAG: hypothetical protein ACSNEK_08450 [Parachlamydiaceae bacterium]
MFLLKELSCYQAVAIAEKTYQEINPKSFQVALSNINSNIQKSARKILKRELGKTKGYVILVTGSDGRYEKMNNASPIELIVVTKGVNQPIIDKIKEIPQKVPMFSRVIDLKDIHDPDDKLLCFNRCQDSHQKDFRPFPSRALDASFLFGQQKLYGQYKISFFEELCSSKATKDLRKFRASARSSSLTLLKNNLAGKAGHFDPNTGELFYDGDRIKGPKYPLLRVVQYSLVDHVCKLINKGKINQKDFSELPKSTLERIDWLRKKKLLVLSKESGRQVKQVYSLSLLWYSEGQRLHTETGRGNLVVSSIQLRQVAEIVMTFGECVANAKI